MKSLYCNHGLITCDCAVSEDWKVADVGVWYLDECTTPTDVARVFERASTNPHNTYAVLLHESMQEVAELLEWQLGNVFRNLGEFMNKMEEVLDGSTL